jgi:hypothetical protein
MVRPHQPEGISVTRLKDKVALAAASVIAASGIVVAGVTADPPPYEGPTSPSVGRQESCVLDANSGCVRPHGFAETPSSITATHGGPAVVGISAIGATSYRIDFRRPDTGGKYATGTPVRFNVHYDFAARVAPTPTPEPEPEPTTTPPPDPEPGNCDDPFVTTSNDNNGGGTEMGEYYVHNNMWNNHPGGDNGPAGTYTLTACSADDWNVVATQPDSPSFAVRAYPNIHKDYNDVDVETIQSVDFAHEAVTRVPGERWNVAFDVWMGEGENGFANELMIWTEWQDQTPAGSRISSSVVVGGVEYELWRLPGGQDIITFRTKSGQPLRSGNMPLHLFFDYLKELGWILPNATTWQVDYGVEVVDTEGSDGVVNDRRWTFKRFSINEN